MWQWGVVLFMLAAVTASDETEAAAERARAALAEQLQMDAEAIDVLEVEPAEWPNAALGCPEKGKVYAQVLTSGYRVQLGHEGNKKWAHVAGKRVVFCGSPPRASKDSTLYQTIARVSREVRRDLAVRLGVDEATVKVEGVRPAPADVDLENCPPSVALDPPPSGGETLLVTLRVRGTVHRYRSDREQITYCGT